MSEQKILYTALDKFQELTRLEYTVSHTQYISEGHEIDGAAIFGVFDLATEDQVNKIFDIAHKLFS